MIKKVNSGVIQVSSARNRSARASYLQLAVIGLGILGLSGLLLFGYQWRVARRERTAQLDLAQCLRDYEKALYRGGHETLQDAQELFQAGYERNSSSYLAPYFKLFQADIMVELNNKSGGVALMDAALGQVHHSARAYDMSLYFLYATKRALINIDLDNPAGIEQLKEAAHDKANAQPDMALYYLGLYYWSRNEIDAARQEWQALMNLKTADAQANSLWMGLAQQKLEQIV